MYSNFNYFPYTFFTLSSHTIKLSQLSDPPYYTSDPTFLLLNPFPWYMYIYLFIQLFLLIPFFFNLPTFLPLLLQFFCILIYRHLIHICLIFLWFNHIQLFTYDTSVCFLLPPTFFFFPPSLHSFSFLPFSTLFSSFFSLFSVLFCSFSFFSFLSLPSLIFLSPSLSSFFFFFSFFDSFSFLFFVSSSYSFLF